MPTGKWYASCHVEFNYSSGPWCTRRIVLVTSVDKGATWHNEGDIVTAYSAGGSPNYDCGWGDQNMYVDSANGYAYIGALRRLSITRISRFGEGICKMCAQR